MTELKKVLMNSYNLTSDEADKEIQEMTNRISDGEDIEEVLYDSGLESDYIFDLI